MTEFFFDLDQQLFLILNGLNSNFFDQLMFYVSEKFTWLPLYALLLFLVFRRYHWRGFWVLVLVVVMVTLSDQTSVLIKKSVMRPRPCHEASIQGMVHLVRGYCGGKYGFVSSHAANTFALAVFINFLLGNKIRWIPPVMFTYACLNAYSRIYLGVHYPGDVVAGAMLGILVGIFIRWLWKLSLRLFQRVKTGLPAQ